ncbi:hypothetical protein HB852_05360 [Listeria grandensis]|uniref:Bacterial Ig domain-containing protein n=1 Tax=Listeria grandensis TaxID=1494963 RepID=A0A7X0Y401_9LIST|nr:immunoglobulin-like domain-containing protein [Listeria grandensis]MBC1474035.1 hypothetical protein [Listeria grandensis]MBC1936363.1 hypothetical protein [Listeria grandensis]
MKKIISIIAVLLVAVGILTIHTGTAQAQEVKSDPFSAHILTASATFGSQTGNITGSYDGNVVSAVATINGVSLPIGGEFRELIYHPNPSIQIPGVFHYSFDVTKYKKGDVITITGLDKNNNPITAAKVVTIGPPLTE